MDLPPAPTPPVNGGVGPNQDRTANLLNLLKFSGSNSSSAASHQHQPPSQPQPQTQQTQTQQQQQQAQAQPQPSQQQHLHQQQQPEMTDDEQDHYTHLNNTQQHQLAQQQANMQSPKQFPTRIHQPAPAAADPTGLLAALMRGAHDVEEPKPAAPPPQLPQSMNPFASGSPTADTRSYLLNLLNRPKPSQTDQPLMVEAPRSNEHSPQSPEPPAEAGRYFGHHHQQPPNPYHTQAPYQQPAESFVDVQHSANPFSYPSVQEPADMSALYQTLMGTLSQASPQNSAHGSAAPPFQILKDQSSPAGSQHFDAARAAHERSPITSPPQQARQRLNRTSSLHSHQSHHSGPHSVKQTPPTSDFDSFVTVDRNNETVSEATHDFAGRADRDEQALERAERQTYAEVDNTTVKPHDDSDWIESATPVDALRSVEKQIVEDIKSDHASSRAYGSSDQKDVAEPAQDTDNAHIIADSWESADQDEIVVIEEKEAPAVKVYNFPMKPWITITLQEDATEPRPQFREESIMDIARLKKDFDQIDRNLYTASQTYMTYGMSKQGGLRVIRQDDGKDAKIFTDTKDRIFNVAISVTPPDHDGVSREAIIGTGISGTVYWVQIKDGEKDHIEDTHLEQYGFALPPVNSQDGDAPGGALKTRARASTIHPEFFAVGRGKSINFIWPSYILQNNLFKPGHDRVADTEALLNQSSLKINTGKAGKDFTFSQDDTVVVSLDKSGRVKFWDVRDLTAVKEGSDPRAPMPAQSSLEIKEPLMTLASTPEGEKAWPTSVLLLDKQRPYQKRCALRYMIVGMKQNHTLQLWDLALGKPVQEFNLPHSKESDAVCSVMYHPASGMIIIGHPTRNSVYFAHLSAPKYNLKGVSQAEYIQRLVAQDASIPQPDSTAVISGVREYSFANRGILRSLDILANPAMVQDADEPTLFELYAMHSKGVACLLIKQAELGWSKDNKVLEPVDAVTEGVVTVSKLKSPQQTEINNSSASESAPVRIATRTVIKDPVVQSTPATSEATPRGAESVTPVKFRNDVKEAETPVQSSKENQTEKPERKQRKKKGKDSELAANGSTASHKGDAAKGVNGLAVGISSEALDSAISGLETRLGSSVSDTLKSSLNNLHDKIDERARVRDESFNKHQLKLLDMVSEVLNENTQKVLESLIQQQFTDVVIPSIGDKTGKAVTELLQNKLQPNITASVQKEIQNALPHALNRSLRSGDFVNAVSDRVSSAVSTGLQQEVLATLTQRLTPSFNNIATLAAQRVASDLHQSYHEQFEQMKAQHAVDNNKIDQLLSYVTRLTDMVSTMATSQSSLQAEFLKFKQQPVELPVGSAMVGIHAPHVGSVAHSMASHGYGNNSMVSHRSSFPPSQAPSQAPSHTQSHAQSHVQSHTQSHAQSHVQSHPQSHPQHYNSPQYMRGSHRGSQPIPSPQGSAPPSEHVVSASNVRVLAGAYANQMSKTEAEADNDLVQRIRVIEQFIAEGRLQDAMIQWIQSGREAEIFGRSLSRYPPNKFDTLPPLMLLVVMATISKDLKPNARLKEEVEWIEMAVRAFGENMPNYNWDSPVSREVMKSTSQTMQLLINRVQPLIAGIQDGFPTDPFLANLERGKLEWIVRTSEHILETFRRY